MITIQHISQVNYADYDEVWAIVRSLKYSNSHIRHVPELSPSWALFKQYLRLREEGRWDENTFHRVYVPQFLKEMRGKKQQALLNELFSTTKRICLVCFCMEEELCHRSIIGGMLQGAGLEVKGLSRDYSYYFNWYKHGSPSEKAEDQRESEKRIKDVNLNTVFLYSKTDDEILFDDDIPTMCFTGRRPKDLCGYNTAKYNSFVSDFTKLLYEEFYVKKGVRRFISGAAQGLDQMAFWAVERMKKLYKCEDIENVVFVAFEGQEVRWAKSGCFSQAEYWMMIEHADRVVVVCEENNVESLFTRNHMMCDYSSICLGLYPDDSWHTAKGGTSECLRYAAVHAPDVFRLGYTVDNNGLHIGALFSL